MGADDVDLHKGVVHVEGVQAGEEEELRHRLEALIDQANAAQEQREASDSDGKPQASGGDAELTEHFRAFAGDEAPKEAGPS